MAESIIQVSPDSTGKKLHTFNRTIGANSVEDEVVLLGENYLASYVVPTGSSTATANSHLIQIMAGASLKLRIRRITVTQTVLATTAGFCDLVLFRVTTAGTGGTATTPQPLDTTDAAAGATSQTLPTAKGTEGGFVGRRSIYMMQTAGASSSLYTMTEWNFDSLRSKPIIIAAGATNGLVIKNLNAVAAGALGYEILFDESNF